MQSKSKPIEDPGRADDIIRIKQYHNVDYPDLFFGGDECVLVYNTRIEGKKVIGKVLSNLDDNELILCGSQIPAFWFNIKTPGKIKPAGGLIVMSFNPEKLLNNFSAFLDTQSLGLFLKTANRGIRFIGDTRNDIAALLIQATQLRGFEKIIALFKIINLFTISGQYHFINGVDYLPPVNSVNFKPLGLLFRLAFTRFKNNISLTPDLENTDLDGNALNMNRLFKKLTDLSFHQFLNIQRLDHACKLLSESDLPVGAIAHESGFKTVVNFNKAFKKHLGCSPKHFREQRRKPLHFPIKKTTNQ